MRSKENILVDLSAVIEAGGKSSKVGELLRELRLSLGLSFAQMATIAKVSVQTVRRWESSKITVRLPTIFRLIKVLSGDQPAVKAPFDVDSAVVAIAKLLREFPEGKREGIVNIALALSKFTI